MSEHLYDKLFFCVHFLAVIRRLLCLVVPSNTDDYTDSMILFYFIIVLCLISFFKLFKLSYTYCSAALLCEYRLSLIQNKKCSLDNQMVEQISKLILYSKYMYLYPPPAYFQLFHSATEQVIFNNYTVTSDLTDSHARSSGRGFWSVSEAALTIGSTAPSDSVPQRTPWSTCYITGTLVSAHGLRLVRQDVWPRRPQHSRRQACWARPAWRHSALDVRLSTRQVAARKDWRRDVWLAAASGGDAARILSRPAHTRHSDCGLVAWLINVSTTRPWRKYWESRRTPVYAVIYQRARPAVKWRGYNSNGHKTKEMTVSTTLKKRLAKSSIASTTESSSELFNSGSVCSIWARASKLKYIDGISWISVLCLGLVNNFPVLKTSVLWCQFVKMYPGNCCATKTVEILHRIWLLNWSCCDEIEDS